MPPYHWPLPLSEAHSGLKKKSGGGVGASSRLYKSEGRSSTLSYLKLFFGPFALRRLPTEAMQSAKVMSARPSRLTVVNVQAKTVSGKKTVSSKAPAPSGLTPGQECEWYPRTLPTLPRAALPPTFLSVPAQRSCIHMWACGCKWDANSAGEANRRVYPGVPAMPYPHIRLVVACLTGQRSTHSSAARSSAAICSLMAGRRCCCRRPDPARHHRALPQHVRPRWLHPHRQALRHQALARV